MNLAEDYVKFCCQWVLDHNLTDVRIIDGWRKRQHQQKAKQQQQQQKKGKGKGSQESQPKSRSSDESAEDRLKNVCSKPFARVSYTEAIEILQKAERKFEFKV